MDNNWIDLLSFQGRRVESVVVVEFDHLCGLFVWGVIMLFVDQLQCCLHILIVKSAGCSPIDFNLVQKLFEAFPISISVDWTILQLLLNLQFQTANLSSEDFQGLG